MQGLAGAVSTPPHWHQVIGDTGHSPHTADGPRHAALQHVTSPAATLLHTPDTAPVSAVMQCLDHEVLGVLFAA